MNGICRFCGVENEGISFDRWVKPTFTDWDKLLPGNLVCRDCLFFFDEQNVELAQNVGKEKPQRMRNYSHFIINGNWEPLSKGNKGRMRDILLVPPFPELAVIADSGQKHLVFRALRNAPGLLAGWVQFEEARLWIEPSELAHYLNVIDTLYTVFSKEEIETGKYSAFRLQQFGLDQFLPLENEVKLWRGSLLFSFALFLAQRSNDGRDAASGGNPVANDLAGNTERLQEQISPDNLGAIRERDRERGIYEQSGQVRQLPLFEI